MDDTWIDDELASGGLVITEEEVGATQRGHPPDNTAADRRAAATRLYSRLDR
jgi:hypothetical protein